MKRRTAYGKRVNHKNCTVCGLSVFFGSLKNVVIAGAILFIILSFACSSLVDAHNDVTKYYTSVYVESGDTLWDLANTYCSVEYHDKDAYIKEVMRLNHLTSSEIHSGNYLILPYYDSENL